MSPKAIAGGWYEKWRLLPFGCPVVAYTTPFDGHPSKEVRGYYIRPGARLTHWVAIARRKDARGGWWVEECNVRVDRAALRKCDPKFQKSVTEFLKNSQTILEAESGE